MTWRVNTTMNDDIAILGRLTAGPAREVDLVAAAIADGSSYHQAVDRVHAVAADLLSRRVVDRITGTVTAPPTPAAPAPAAPTVTSRKFSADWLRTTTSVLAVTLAPAPMNAFVVRSMTDAPTAGATPAVPAMATVPATSRW